MSMKIFILGNMATGKTHIVNSLSDRLKNFQIMSVDKYREEYGDGTWTMENKVKMMFVDGIDIKGKNQIIEANGGGRIGDMLKLVIPEIKDKIIVFLIISSDQVRIERLRGRTRKPNIPFEMEDAAVVVRKSNSLEHLRKLTLFNPGLKFYEMENNNDSDLNKILNKIISLVN